MKEDTKNLLRECNAGCKIAVNSLETALLYAKDPEIRAVLERCRERHETLGEECGRMLHAEGDSGAEPHPMARVMSKLGTRMRLSVQNSNARISSLMADGCAMGIRSVGKYKNRYAAASPESRALADSIISAEEETLRDMVPFF